MSQEEFELYVARLETYAQQHPVSYKLRVALAAALGYAYVYAVLGLAVVLFGLCGEQGKFPTDSESYH